MRGTDSQNDRQKTGFSRLSETRQQAIVADEQIAALIGSLLLHYRQDDMSQAAQNAVAKDWMADLREFGPRIVEEACTEYRRTQKFRPTPAEIRKLCIEAQNSQRERDQRRSLPASGAARREWSSPEEEDAYARKAGWSSALERRDAIAQQEEKYRLAEIWRRETRFSPGNTAISPAKRAEAPQYTPEQMVEFRRQLGIEVTEEGP